MRQFTETDRNRILLEWDGKPRETVTVEAAQINHAIFQCVDCERQRVYGFLPAERRHVLIYCQQCQANTFHFFVGNGAVKYTR